MEDLKYINEEEVLGSGGILVLIPICLIFVLTIPFIPFIIKKYIKDKNMIKDERQRRKERRLKYISYDGFFDSNISFETVPFKHNGKHIVTFTKTFEAQYSAYWLKSFYEHYEIIMFTKDLENNCYKYVTRRL